VNPKNFFAELKRRHVYKVAIAYAVVAWLLMQVASQIFPFFEIPNWAVRLVVLLLVIGFPVAMILAWAFELTPEGIKRAEDVDLTKPNTRKRGRKLDFFIIAVLLLVIAALLFQRLRPNVSSAVSSSLKKSIAVLPFVDLSQAKDQEYFCDGISEEILDALAKVEGLRVVARTSSFSFKGKNADVGQIAQKLNVQNVLEGSLRREGNRIRITAQLINARNGFHIWSDTFERELQGVFAVQDEITRSIVDALKIKLAVAPPVRTPESTEAYDLYLKGLYYSNKSDEENLRKSLSLFQQALDKDPNFARAWTGIAKAWEALADAYVQPLEAYPKVKEAAWKALALDDMDAGAHCYLGEVKLLIDRDVAGGEAEVKRALQLDRNSATAHFYMSWLKSTQGDCDEAVKQIQEAEKLDPLSPMIIDSAVERYVGADRLDDAISAGKRLLQVDPNYIPRGGCAV
jgi:TolB-like protein